MLIQRRRLLDFLGCAAIGAAFPAQAKPHLMPHPAAPKPLVMIDPGHGGKDPGAIGYAGTYEKHIAYAAAEAVQRRMNATGRHRVMLTRTGDHFIPLEDRVAIARQQGAALFISMHADALADRGVRGASVYTLAAAASDAQSAALAQRENSADRFAGAAFAGQSPEVASILASLVRQETRRGSARLQSDMVDALRGTTSLLDHTARRASFVVLKAADIPSVLVEMGFMSNPDDEAALRRPEHRARIAAAVHRAADMFLGTATTTA